jgi:hypothetical protein
MKIQKMLVLGQIPGKWERIDLESITKIGSFDELKFANDLHRIRFVQLSSGLEASFMLLTIDGTVYKYDLATKELLFSFKSQATKGLLLSRQDRRLLVADT